MNELRIETDERLLGDRNNEFLRLLAMVSAQFDINYNDAQLASFAVSPDDIANVNTDGQQLVADISNKDARTKQFGILENKKGALAQLYWKKYSSFMVDLIATQANVQSKSGMNIAPEKFTLNLGLSRHLIGLFTEQVRFPEKQIFTKDIEHIIKQYVEDHELFVQYQQYERYGLYRQIGRKQACTDLFVQSMPDGLNELRETIPEKNVIWPTALFPTLKASIELQQENIKKSYPYSINVNGIEFYANKPIQEMLPTALSRIESAIRDTFDEICNHVIVDVQPSGECYLSVKTDKTGNYGVVQHNIYHKFYFPNQFIGKNEGQGFYLGYISDSEYSYMTNEASEKQIICIHSARHSEMNDIVDTKYKEVLKALVCNTDVDTFLKTLFSYSFLHINVMPYARGSAAIGEWLMRGLAKAKGVELGAFSNKLSWDFSAFVHISAEKYAAEYKEYFSHIKLLSMSEENTTTLMSLNSEIREHIKQHPTDSKELVELQKHLNNLNQVENLFQEMTYFTDKSNKLTQGGINQPLFRDKDVTNFYLRACQLVGPIVDAVVSHTTNLVEEIEPQSSCCCY